ncbi:MAG: glycosyltransferase family 4 protein [Polyangiales bacterium]
MRIALLSTCAVAVPPKAYGGTELITAELAKSLVSLGHDVTVYATGDSRPAGKLRFRFTRPVWPPNDLAELRHAAFAWNHIAAQQATRPFDVIHTHQAPSLAFATMHATPTLLTLHHERDPSLLDFYLDFPDVRYVAISRRQAELAPEMRVEHVVHHGLDPALYDAGDGEGGYCAFLGRVAQEKGLHFAIDAALAAEVPLKIGGKPHWKDKAYFEREVQPRLTAAGAKVESLGEVSHAPKVELLRHARALLFPIDWEEPFGLVMIEAMLVGTPVIAFARGSVPEVVEDGVTGFVVRDVAEMAARLREVGNIDRKRCRERAQERWSSLRMAKDYVKIYEQAIRARRRPALRMWGVGPDAADGAPRPSSLPSAAQEGEHVAERISGFGGAGAGS